MPEEATRRLLKQFGMAVTDLEEQTQSTLERLQTLGQRPIDAAATLEILEQWLKLSREVTERWLEMTRLIVENQTRAQAELLRLIGDARTAGK
jgi:DNA-binding ferritin-like protein